MALYAFDGTGDDDRDLGSGPQEIADETNVWKFYQAYKGLKPEKNNVYVQGLGTKLGPIGLAIGGAFGAGWVSRIHDTYDTLCKNFLAGDHEIDVVGFSRGSALALGFVNKIFDDGIKKDDRTVVEKPSIRFLGLFDVVAAFGAAALGGPFKHLQPLHKLTLPANVGHCFHAMSLDERRISFEVTRVKGAYEVWFRGVHCDVGGSNDNLGLSNIALRWMWHKAMLCDLPFTDANLNPGHDGCSPTDKINPAAACKAEQLFWRTVKASDLIHYTVPQHIVLAGEKCNPHVPLGPIMETVDFEKNRRDRPAVEGV